MRAHPEVGRGALLIFFLLLLSPCLAQPEPSSAEAFAERGVARMESGDDAAALSDAERSLQLDPESFEGLLLMGRLLTKKDQPLAGLEYLRRALERRPQDPMAMRSVSLALFESGQQAQGRELLEQAIALHPTTSGLYYNRAYYLWKGKDTLTPEEADQVVQDLDRACQLDPKDPQCVGARGWVRWKYLFDNERALEDVSAALALRPSIEDLILRATIYGQLERYREAHADLRHALSLGGDEDTMRRIREQMEITPAP